MTEEKKQFIGSRSGRVSPQDAECTRKNVERPLQEPTARKVAEEHPKTNDRVIVSHLCVDL